MWYLFVLKRPNAFVSRQNVYFMFQRFKIYYWVCLKDKKTNNTYDKDILPEHTYIKKVQDKYQIFKDGKPFKTIFGSIFEFPFRKRSFAYMVSEELSSIDEHSKYYLLPLTSLATKAIDVFSTENSRESRYHDLLKYLDTDTILFFAPESESNGELLILQKKSWEPLHEWAQNYWKVDILKTFCDLGINFHFQPQKTKDKIISWMRSLDKWQFAALDRAVCVSKSFIIGAKMVVAENGPSDEYLSIEKICDLVQLELHFQISRWGKIKEIHNTEDDNIKQLLKSVSVILKDDK